MKGKGIKGAIAASALSAVLCAGMLAGTTFAWFTDTVSSSGNRIMAGNLDITATVAEQTADGAEVSYEVGGEIYGFGTAVELTGQAIINEEGWQPGDWNAKLLTVSNAESTLAATVRLQFVITDDGLTDALWFDFVQVSGDTVIGDYTQRPMKELEQLASVKEYTVEAGGEISFILFYGMYENAGNTYQGESFGVDAYVLAKQAMDEASYPVMDTAGLTEAIKDNANIVLGKSLTGLENRISFTGVENVGFDLNGKDILNNGNEYALRVDGGSQNVVISNGTVATEEYVAIGVSQAATATLKDLVVSSRNFNDPVIKAFVDSHIDIVDCEITAENMGGVWAFETAQVNITDTKITQKGTQYGGIASWFFTGAFAANGSSVNLYGNTIVDADGYGLYILSSGGTINVYGGSYSGGKAVLKADSGVINVYGGTFDGAISISSQATLRIEAGTFTTTGMTLDAFRDYVAEGSTVTEDNGAFVVAKN